MRNSIVCIALFILASSSTVVSAYPMSQETYSNMFAQADVVVIATPITTQQSKIDLKLELEQPKYITDTIMTVDTKFEVAYVLKGTLETNTFHFLHLNLKKKQPSGIRLFGAVGTFLVDFESKENQRPGEFMRKGNKQNSFILFMKKRKDGTFCPAWRPMEGSRAIIPVRKNGEL